MYTLRMPARLLLAGMLSIATLAAAIDGASAQDTTAKPAAAKAGASTAPLVIIVIDEEKIRRESEAGKSLDAQAETFSKSFEDETRAAEASLIAARQDIDKQRATLTQEQFAEKVHAYEQKAADASRADLKRRQAMDRSYNAAFQKWRQAMIDAAQEVATSHNADVVVRSQALMFYNTAWDVTSEVIALMNKRVTKIDFPPPKIEPDPPAAGAAAAGQDTSKEKKPKPQLQLSPQQ